MGNLLPSHDYEPAAQEDFCHNVTYQHRVLDPDTWTWCPVPDSSYDGVFFAAFAVFTVCVAPPKYATLVCLIAGCVYQLFANYWNLGHVSNSVVLWLNMSPADMFVYAFFPPLLLDSAVRMDFFMLRKVIWNVMFLAFIMVLSSALLLIPFMLWGLGLDKDGWNAVYVALFGTMIGSTDAASCIAILKAGGAPELLSIVLEGESLFNDASSLTMFEIFKNIVLRTDEGLGRDVAMIAVQTVIAFTGGVAIGLGMGIFVMFLLRWLQWRRLTGVIEIAVSVAAAYMSYYITQVYVEASGVVAVVTFGLVGSATMLWGTSKKLLQGGEFFAFWDTFVFILNGIIFFYVGASSTNLVQRASEFINENPDTGPVNSLSQFFARMAAYVSAIYAFSFATRFWFVFKSFKIFEWTGLGAKLTFKEMIFVSVAGLRGSLSLVLVQTVIKIAPDVVDATSFVRAEIALWTTAYVLLTLVVNAPLLGPLLSVLGLNKISVEGKHIQKQVEQMLQQHSEAAISQLRANPDELLEGVQWSAVEDNVMLWHTHFLEHGKHAEEGPHDGGDDDRPSLWWRFVGWWSRCWGRCTGKAARGKVDATRPDLARSTSGRISALYLNSHFMSPGASSNGRSSSALPDQVLSGMTPGAADGQRQQSAGAKAHQQESNGLAAVGGAAAGGFPAAGSPAGAEAVIVVPNDVELAVMNGKPATTTPFATRAATLGVEPIHGGAWDDLEMRVEEYIAETQDEESFFPESSADSGQLPQAGAGRPGEMPAASEIRAMGPSLQDMPLRAPTMPRDVAAYLTRHSSSQPSTTKAANIERRGTARRIHAAGPDVEIAMAPATAGFGVEELPLPPAVAGADASAPPLAAAAAAMLSGQGADQPHVGDGGAAAPAASYPLSGVRLDGGAVSADAAAMPPVGAAASSIVSNGSIGRATLPRQPSDPTPRLQGMGAEETDEPGTYGGAANGAKPRPLGSLVATSVPVQSTSLVRPSRMIALQPQGAFHSSDSHGPLRPNDKIILVRSKDPTYGVRQIRMDTQQPASNRAGGLGTISVHRQIHRLTAQGKSSIQEETEGDEEEGADDGARFSDQAAKQAGMEQQVQQMLPEYRMRLLTGLRQHFRARYHEGIINLRSFDILNYACNKQLHGGSDQPLALWQCAEKEVSRKWTLRAAGRLVFLIRRSVMDTKRREHGRLASAWFWLYRAMLKGPAWLLSQFLDRSMTVGLEVAMELWQALSGSPKTLWLSHSGPTGVALLQEVKQQSDLAWSFVIDRRVEAPEKFQAIQTYRATLAVLSQQSTFVEELLDDGVIEEKEADDLADAVARRRQAVERDGPVRRRPQLRQILADSNLMQGVPPEVVKSLRTKAQLKIYKKGEAIFESDARDPWKGGLLLVVSGVVRLVMEVRGSDVSVYLGAGTGVGLLSCVIQAYVPGVTPRACYAEGDSMARGPVVLFLPWPVLQGAIQLSRKHGLPAYRAMDLHFMRRAAALILDAMRGTTTASLAQHIQHLLMHILVEHKQRITQDHATTAAAAATAAAAVDRPQMTRTRSHHLGATAGSAASAATAAAAAAATTALRRKGSARIANGLVPATSTVQSRATSDCLMRLCSLLEVLDIPGSSVAEQLLAMSWELACSVVDDKEFVPRELIDLKELLARQISATVHSIHERLTHLVGEGRLLILAPGQAFVQDCTAVLVQGRLVAPSEAQGAAAGQLLHPVPGADDELVPLGADRDEAGNGGRGEQQQAASERVLHAAVIRGAAGAEGEAPVAQEAPSLMLWSPDFIPYAISGELAHPAQLVAGPSGAEIIVLGSHVGALQAL